MTKTGSKHLDLFLFSAAGAVFIAWALSFRSLLLEWLESIIPADGIMAELISLVILTIIILALIFAGIKVRK